MSNNIKDFPSWPSYSQEEAEIAKQVILSNKVNYWTGSECRLFEKEFSKFTGSNHSIALANGTLALELALHALGIKKGDEVIVTSRTFLASVSSIVNKGAIPVFADISPETQNIDPNAVRRAVTKKTKAVMCVHLAGWPCDMDEILKIAKENKLLIIEDCAQAHGAKYKGRSVGSIGDIGCWSFCQDKIMTTVGEGGMVTTNSKTLWEKMWSYKDHGKSFDAVYNTNHKPGFRWLHESFGSNFRMTELQGAVGRFQLKKMPEWTQKRNFFQDLIWKRCSDIKGIRVPKPHCGGCSKDSCKVKNGCVHGAYKAYVFVEEQMLHHEWTRDKIINEIEKDGIPCFHGSCSEVYLEKAFHDKAYCPESRLPVAKLLGETSLCFLIHPTLTEDHINQLY